MTRAACPYIVTYQAHDAPGCATWLAMFRSSATSEHDGNRVTRFETLPMVFKAYSEQNVIKHAMAWWEAEQDKLGAEERRLEQLRIARASKTKMEPA